jgi:hypothetical protein
MSHKLLYALIGGATALIVKEMVGKDGARPVVKGVYKGIARMNRGLERMTAEMREDLEDARQEVAREEAMPRPVV